MTTPLIRRLTLQNFLSYGPEGVTVDLLPLNVLIGPNASGKSNLLEALLIFRAATGDLQATLREGGGTSEYMHKGGEPPIYLEAVVDYPLSSSVIRHEIGLYISGSRFIVGSEFITVEPQVQTPSSGGQHIYESLGGSSVLHMDDEHGEPREVHILDLKLGQSILAQRRDPVLYPALTFLGNQFASIALFRDWNTARRSAARLPQPTDLPSDFLLPDASNIALILHDLSHTSAQRDELVGFLRRFYEQARGISTKLIGGTLQLFIEEEGGRLIPATRLSDGTLRFLCLLAILLHPNPPPVIGIEEPELGLHPDIMPTIAELLKKASERTQLFVTTHSDALVSALSDTPESILVCESMPGGTTINRLEPEKLREWLADYSLGEVWRMGAIGGNRW
jgi:predicted ATPase